MKELHQQLQTVFMFQSTDLQTNRRGKLSQRQQTRLRAGRSSMLIGLWVFIFVMIGTLGFIIFMQHQSSKDYNRNVAPLVSAQVAERVTSDQWASVIILAAVIGIIIVACIIWFLIQRVRSKTLQISVTKGKAEVISEDPANNNIKIKIGPTTLKLMTLDQLEAFAPGIEYRVFYLAGPRPTVLSAEVVRSEEVPDLSVLNEQDEVLEQNKFMQLQKRGRVLVLMIGLAAAAIPFLGVFASSLPKGWRTFAWITLFVIAIGFVPFAMRRLSPHKPKNH
jgi:hypothetical protein